MHATAVAIGGDALAIFGPSGAGKSHLAFALLRRATLSRPIRLIGDDRVLLQLRADGQIIVRPHPRIAGFIERRGLGIVAARHVARAPLRALVMLEKVALPDLLLNFPCFHGVGRHGTAASEVLDWWRDLRTTGALNSPAAGVLPVKD